MFLLDTNVVSELRRTRPHGALISWIQQADERDLHLSAVTFGEIQSGIEIARANDPVKAEEIEKWADQVAATWNVLPMDTRCFRVWAKLMSRQSRDLFEDAMIAATAQVHSLTVVTRNTRDFAQLGIDAIDPFSAT